MTDTAPKTEVGYAGTAGGLPTAVPGMPGTPAWSYFVDVSEDPAELRWPMSVRTFHKMRRDSQVDGLLLCYSLPIRRRTWGFRPNGARDEVVETIAADFGLPILGSNDPPPQRRRRRFNHDDHIRHALLAGAYGHMIFEQVGDIGEDSAGQPGAWRLRKLAPRMPQSIQEFRIAKDGGLEGIVQYGASRNTSRPWEAQPIPTSQLIAYVWDKEGDNWAGRSMLYSLFREWVLKDRLLRVDAMRHERWGVGIPVSKAPKGSDRVAEHGKLAQSAKGGPEAGVGLPFGADFWVEGVRGAMTDVMGSVQRHDEAMARKFLAMFAQLGQTETGSRALGDTFLDFFELAVDATANWYARTTNEHMVEDMVDWNWGQEENAPILDWYGHVADEDEDEEPLAASDLVALIGGGVISVDSEVEGWVRNRYGMPPVPEQVASGVQAAVRRRRVRLSSQTATDDRIGHRERYDHEVKAATNFDAMQVAWQQATDDLVSEWADVRAVQIDHLVQAVETAVASGSPQALAALQAPVLGTDIIAAAMIAAAEEAIAAARAEAAAQGVTIELIDVAELAPMLNTRADAVATLLARSISETAARQALVRYGVNVLEPADVAAGVRDQLESLSDAYLNDQLGGSLTQAQNTGRRAVMGRRPARIYASELLDQNTCIKCKAKDGTEYSELTDAEKDYPTGGYSECLGGPRCRGTLVAVYDEADASEEVA